MNVEFSKYYQPKPKQAEAHKCRAKYLLFGGAMGGGKSFWLCAEAIKQAMKYNGNRLIILRKELSVMRRTILVTFFKICPPQIIRTFNQTTLEVTFVNGSVLTFIEANISKDPLMQKLKGLEIGWFGIDEANEVSEEVYKILKTRLRWVLPNGKLPRYEGRLTSNPENCWLLGSFINSCSDDEVYIQSLTTDNYAETDSYVIGLKEAFKDSPNLLRKYLEGDWSLVDSINQLIPSKAIQDAANRVEYRGVTSMGIDVARYGNDRTVFVILKDSNIEHIESHAETSIPQVVGRAIELIKQYNIIPEAVGIDVVGVGAGVVDYLKNAGYNVCEIQGGAKPLEESKDEPFKPFNLRSQIFYALRNEICEGRLGNITDRVLRQELSMIRYEISADRTVKIVSKDVIKKLLGKSPDYADALAYASWVITHPAPYRGPMPFIVGGIVVGDK